MNEAEIYLTMRNNHKEELEAFKYLLKITEDLLVAGGYPQEILTKYHSLKEITLKKLPMTPENNSIIPINEKNELSFQNQSEELEVGILKNFLDSLLVSLNQVKNNIKTFSSENKDLSEISFKIIETTEPFKAENHLYQIVKENEAKYSIFFNEIKELFEKAKEGFDKTKQYIKDLEKHIEEIQKIDQNPEKQEKKEPKEINENSNSFVDSLEDKKLRDNIVELQCEKQILKEQIISLEAQIQEQEEQYNEIIVDLQNKNQYLELKYEETLKENLKDDSDRQFIEYFENNFCEIIEKFENLRDSFLEKTPKKDHNENLIKLKFLKHLFLKFEDDNLWLIGKLKEISSSEQICEIGKSFSEKISSNDDRKQLENIKMKYLLAENQLKATLQQTKNFLHGMN